jgi:hypothetical protein
VVAVSLPPPSPPPGPTCSAPSPAHGRKSTGLGSSPPPAPPLPPAPSPPQPPPPSWAAAADSAPATGPRVKGPQPPPPPSPPPAADCCCCRRGNDGDALPDAPAGDADGKPNPPSCRCCPSRSRPVPPASGPSLPPAAPTAPPLPLPLLPRPLLPLLLRRLLRDGPCDVSHRGRLVIKTDVLDLTHVGAHVGAQVGGCFAGPAPSSSKPITRPPCNPLPQVTSGAHAQPQPPGTGTGYLLTRRVHGKRPRFNALALEFKPPLAACSCSLRRSPPCKASKGGRSQTLQLPNPDAPC